MRVGNIEIVSCVGKGNMGTVYKAVHRTLKTPYAVKVLHRRYSQDVNAAERFRREALVCSQLRHPNVVFVTDFGFQKSLGIYIIMEFLDGPTLTSFIEEGPMDAVRTCELAVQICDALGAAHRLGITHRDLKPDNVSVMAGVGEEEVVKVLDFGIASIKARREASITTQGMVLGTPAYMAPEQIQGLKEKLGACTDIYALGVILYEMLTGQLPFFAEEPIELCKMHLLNQPEPLSSLREDLADTMLERLVHRMLAKRPDRRPASMWEVSQLLQASARQLAYVHLDDSDLPLPPLARSHRVGSGPPASGTTLTPARRSRVETCRRLAPGSAVHRLLAAHPALAAASDIDFFLLMWGPMYRELIDTRLDSEIFEQNTALLVELVSSLLNNDQVGHEARSKALRCLGELMRMAERNRQQRLVDAMRDLTNHPNFPVFVLPSWATAYASGTWKALKRPALEELPAGIKVSSNIQLFDPTEGDEDVPPSLFDIPAHQGGESEGEGDKGRAQRSLLSKLRRPVSVENIRNVLRHDIFGVNPNDPSEPQDN